MSPPEMVHTGYFDSPIGLLQITADDQALCSVSFVAGVTSCISESHLIELTKSQLQSYFMHQLRKFDLPLHLRTTDFQRRVLEEVARIPYGQTITYLQLAHRLGSDRLTRAVAGANASNPFLILLPCHRVVGRNNSMTGYAGEIWRKRWLLDHEKVNQALF